MGEVIGGQPLLAITPFLWTLAEDSGMPSAFRTLTGLAANGFDVHVVLPERGGGSSREYRGLRLHTFDLPTFGLRGDFGPTRSSLLLDAPPGRLAGLRWKAFLTAMLAGSIRRGLAVAKEIEPAIVYGILPTGALAAAFVGRRRRVPNVTRLFGTHLGPVRGAAHAAHLWEIAAFKAPARLVVITDDGTRGDEVAQRLKVPKQRVRFLMNGVDEPFLSRDGLAEATEVKRDLGVDPKAPLLLFAHHLLPSHNALALVGAVALLADEGLKVTAVIAGDGPERAAVEDAVRNSGLTHSVLVIGNVSRERIRELLSAATAVVSLDALSNLVNSVLEALALGIPVVATATGGTTRLLTDRENALLIPRSDTKELAAALRMLLEDHALAQRLRQGAAATARERIESWDDRMSREAQMLREVLAA